MSESGLSMAGATLLASSVLLLTTSCALIPSREGSTPSHSDVRASQQASRLVQLSFGRDATFGVCREPACPKVTPKTIATPANQPVAIAEPQVKLIATALSLDAKTETVVPPAPPAKPRQHILVNFVSGQATLTPAGRATLKAALPFARGSKRIVIAGRTDSVGSEKVNETLAFARALAVRDFIREQIPDLDNVIAIDAKGRCCFVADNETNEGRARNRRVEVVFTLRGDA